MPSPTPTTDAAPAARPFAVPAGPWVGFFGVLLLFTVLIGIKGGLGTFLSAGNLRVMLHEGTIPAIVALGMTMIIVSGGIDLSVGSVVALTGVVAATLLVKGTSPWLATLATILMGGLIGLINGSIIAGLRMLPFIVTLGMMGVTRGTAKWPAGNQTVHTPDSPINHLTALGDPLHFFPLPIGGVRQRQGLLHKNLK